MRIRLLRITTVPESLLILLNGQLEFMQQHGFNVLAVSSNGTQVAEIKKAGIAHRSVLLTRKITPLTDLLALVQIICIIIRFKPVIVHTHTPKAGLLGMLAACICRVPIRLHTVAGLPLMEAHGGKRWLLTLAERITYAAAHKVYPNSTGLMEFIARQVKPNEKKIKLIGKGSSNGINSKHYSRTAALAEEAAQIRNNLGMPDGCVVYGFVGRIVKDKGIKELISAFKKIESVRKNVFLLLVGAAEAELHPIEEADKEYIHSSGKVFMVGYQKDVRPWMLAMDVFVFPSYREGFPNVVMQAACLEIPCIVSDINGCNEIICHNESGLVVPVKNAAALSSGMLELLDYPEKREQFGKRARNFVAHNFEQHLFWKELLTEYRNLLADKTKN